MHKGMTRILVSVLLACGSAAMTPPASAAAGWTDFGTIVELNQNPATTPGNELLFMRISLTPAANPSDTTACHQRDGFYLPVTTDLQKRLFAMLMMAKATDKRVRVYVTATCHLWGYAEMQGLVME